MKKQCMNHPLCFVTKVIKRNKTDVNALGSKWLNEAFITRITSFIALSLVIFVCVFQPAFAEDDWEQYVWSINKDFAKKVLKGGTSDIVDTVKGTGTYSGLYYYVCGLNMPAGVTVGTAIPFEKGISLFTKILCAVSIGWIMMQSVARMIQNISDGRNGLECILKMFLELCISILIIFNLSPIINGMCEIINMLSIKAGEISLFDNVAGEKYKWTEFVEIVGGGKAPKNNGIKGMINNALWNIKLTISLLLPWMMSRLVYIAGLFMLLQTILEIAIRRVFCPLAISDIYSEGLRSPGVRYIKKLLGAIMKFTICIIATTIATSIGATGEGLTLAFNCIVINVVAIGVMFKAGEYTNDILGV